MKCMKITKSILVIMIIAVGMIMPEKIGAGNTSVKAAGLSQEVEIITPETIAIGKDKNAKTYKFSAGEDDFVLPVDIGTSQEAFLDVTISGLSEGLSMILGKSGATIDDVTYVRTQTGNATAHFEVKQEHGVRQNLVISKGEGDLQKEGTISVRFYQYETTPSAQTSLSAGTWALGYNRQGEFLYKIKASKDGVLCLEDGRQDERSSKAEVTLLNAKKKAISEKKDGLNASYAVKKGTYYLQVKTKGIFKFKYTLKSVKSKNTKKSKAVTLKRGKKKEGIIGAGEGKKSYRWYKIVLPKKRKIKIKLKDMNHDGGGSYDLYYKNGKKVDKSIRFIFNDLNADTYELEKNTYYLRIYKPRAKGSFYYSILWK